MQAAAKILIAILPLLLPAETTVHGEIGGSATPTGTIQFFSQGSCPAGWSTYAALQGRYVVGLPDGGTLAGTNGTILTDSENRAVGQHLHTFSMAPHNHAFTGSGDHSHSYQKGNTTVGQVTQPQDGFYQGTLRGTTGSAATGVSIDVKNLPSDTSTVGTDAGTNAPYIQLTPCQKN